MYKALKVLVLTLVSVSAFSQTEYFPFGKISLDELRMTSYASDTTANAVILREFGEAYIQSSPSISLIFTYHVKIKILKKDGLDLGNISIHTFKRGGDFEHVNAVQASSYTLENGAIKESKLVNRQIFSEDLDKNWSTKKFAIPNVQVGSVIEYVYTLETPFFYSNFKSWDFQADIPKIESEYWATIPANWRYNISLKGALPLKKNENSILKDFFTVSSGKSDAVKFKWSMENIPAFYVEDYMTAKKNFLSAIDFELMQIEYFDGRKDKVTKEWKDVEHELRTWEHFGLQLKRGKDVVDDKIEAVIVNETDPLIKANKIFEFIRGWYRWNENYGYTSQTGIRKAFEARKGNIGDINISLIAALRYAGFHTEPLLLSTRENGVPTDLFPVMGDFNYVVAKVNIGEKAYLLDASEDFLPFGVLPMRCLNGRGRVFGDKESYWYDVRAVERSKVVAQVTLTMADDGSLSGEVKKTYLGYRAADRRQRIASFSSIDEFVKDLKSNSKHAVSDVQIGNVEDLSKALTESFKINIESPLSDGMKSGFLNPFFMDRWERNPFRSMERLYPVDFGVPLEQILILTVHLPAGIQAVDLPTNVGLALPNSGGRFFYQVQTGPQKLMVNSNLVVGRELFASTEYPYLKEFFGQVVRVQNTDLVFERKN
jgi:hypothetical protein